MFNLAKLKGDYKKQIENLDNFTIITSIDKKLVGISSYKIGIYLTTSLLKIRLLSSELIDLIDQDKFFSSMGVLRMIFEETVLLTFALTKIEKAKNWDSLDHFITRLSVGRHTGRNEKDTADKKPYNIKTALDDAEKYISKNEPQLTGVFESTYTFISDYVHPNAPSRYYFFSIKNEKVHFLLKTKVHDKDKGLVLNYGCMTLKLYELFWKRINNIKLTKL